MDTDIDTRAGRVNPAEKEKTMKINMKEEEDDFDLVLAGSVEYLVYLN